MGAPGGGGGGGMDFGKMADAIKEASAMQAQSIQKAIDVQQVQFNESLAEIRRQYDTARNDVAPYRLMGETALSALYDIEGLPNPLMNGDYALSVLYSQRQQYVQDQQADQNLRNVQGNNLYSGLPWISDEKSIYNPATVPENVQSGQRISDIDLLINSIRAHSQPNTPEPTMEDAQRKYQQLYAQAVAMNNSGQSMALPTLPNLLSQMKYDWVNRAQVPSGPPDLNIIASNPELRGKWMSLGLPDIFSAGGRQQSQIEAITNNPDYQFRFNQGQKAIANSAAAKGVMDSGSALRGITDYAQGLASLSRGDRVRELMNMVTAGQNAATYSSSQAVQEGQDVSGLRSKLSDVLGSGYMAQGNVLANGLIGSTRWDMLGDMAKGGGGGGMGGMGSLMGMLGPMMGGMGMKRGGITMGESPVLVGENNPLSNITNPGQDYMNNHNDLRKNILRNRKTKRKPNYKEI